MNIAWQTKISLSVLLLTVLTVVPAILHGQLSNRWGEMADLTRAAERLQEFPAKIGQWIRSGEGKRLRDAIARELGFAGYIHRKYANLDSGDEVTLLLMVGRPGPLVRHPPEICYSSQDQHTDRIT